MPDSERSSKLKAEVLATYSSKRKDLPSLFTINEKKTNKLMTLIISCRKLYVPKCTNSNMKIKKSLNPRLHATCCLAGQLTRLPFYSGDATGQWSGRKCPIFRSNKSCEADNRTVQLERDESRSTLHSTNRA